MKIENNDCVSLDQEVRILKQINSKWKNRKPIPNQRRIDRVYCHSWEK